MSNELFAALIAGSLAGGGGGSTETDDYNNLKNKPKINGTKLEGNLSLSDIGAATSDQGDKADSAVQPEDLGSAAAADTSDFATAAQGGKADSAIQGIKVNSTTVNPDAKKVVNITIPTKAADVSALPATTKYAAALRLTINSSTFVVTGQLIDQDGNDLGTAQTIDLPLESVVVDGSYNSQTKEVVLTLQNGNTIEFSVADLVSGLQTELSASNKLNPAYINYDSTHRAVSDTEKSTWNGKQSALTTAQLAAANSGITAERLTADESNISTLAYNNPMAIYSLSIKEMVGAGMVIPEGTQVDMNTGKYVLRFVSDTARNGTLVIYNGATETYRASIDIVGGTNIHRIALNSASDSLKFAISASATITDLTIISAAYYDSGRTGYVEKALPNTKITPELIDLVDSGAKNLLDLSKIKTLNPTGWTGNTLSLNGVDWTFNSDGSITVNGTANSTGSYPKFMSDKTLPIGTYMMSGGSSTAIFTAFHIGSDTGSGYQLDVTSSITQPIDFIGNVAANTQVNNVTIRPMLCTKAAWDVSQKFVPYRPSYEETVEQVTENKNNILAYAIPTCSDTAFTTSATGEYVYTGISFTVPSGEVWEFFVADKYNGSGTTNFSNGLLVSDSSSAITNVSVIAENTQVPSVSGISYWVRQLTGLTPKRTNATTYYVWTNRAVTTGCNIFLCLRRVF